MVTGPRVRSLVDLEQGTISREVFVSEELYQQELERVFARTWLFVGHESQVPNPNDFFVSRMGEESVILTRDRQGQIQVLLNTCMHRGMKVCRYDAGNTPVFSCPYHGWSYSTDGKLVSVPGELIGVPQFATAYHGELQKESWGLVSVPKVHNYKGSIWACWDKNAPDFLDYLGDMKLHLDLLFDHRDGRDGNEAGAEVIAGVLKWKMPCNWKFPAENFLGDHYHGISHRSVEMVGIGPGGPGQQRHGRAIPGGDADRMGGNTAFLGLGHEAGGGPAQPDDVGRKFPAFMSPGIPFGPWDDQPAVAEYYGRVAEARRERMKGRTVETGHGNGNGTVFPNMSYHPWFPRSIVVWHPAGPMVCEGWRIFLVDKDAPAVVKEHLRHYFLRFGGPNGMTESDDMENWNYATEASHGTVARRFPYNYQMSMGHEQEVDGLRDVVWTPGTNEQNQRVFYKHWADLMDAESWDDLGRATSK